MTSVIPPTIDVHLSGKALRGAMERDVRHGLTAKPKQLPPVYFYDDRGSRLFDEITRLPEYYPTRAERSILDAHAGEIARAPRRTRWSSWARGPARSRGSCSTPCSRPDTSTGSSRST